MSKSAIKCINQRHEVGWSMYHGDSIEIIKAMPDDSLHFSIFSPPFSNLYTYSNSLRDLGNCRNDTVFGRHFQFLIAELFRATMPGREVAFHCCNMPAMKEKDGYIGLKPFRNELTDRFIEAGFIFHSEHCIWKDPLIEATRTKSIGLMHKQLMKDSTLV